MSIDALHNLLIVMVSASHELIYVDVDTFFFLIITERFNMVVIYSFILFKITFMHSSTGKQQKVDGKSPSFGFIFYHWFALLLYSKLHLQVNLIRKKCNGGIKAYCHLSREIFQVVFQVVSIWSRNK